MAITYPLSLPTTIGPAQIQFTALNAVAVSQSPFTLAQQVHAYSGQLWQAEVSIPPVKGDLAEAWVAFLISLRGPYGTFYLNDPLNTSPRGTATSMSITGSAGSSSITTTALNGTLKAGDWFSVGTGRNTRLHKVLQDVGAGIGQTVEIYPSLRFGVVNSSTDLTSAKGVFRLSSAETSWSINEVNSYGITFSAQEALL